MTASKKNSPTSYSDIIQPVFAALGVVVVIFAAYEIVERLWLHDLDSHSLHLLHLFRGLFSSLIAAVLVGWFIVKRTPSLFFPSPTTDVMEPVERPTGRERLINFNRWFIHMRWIAIVVAWVLTFIVVQVAEWLPHEVWWPLIITIGVLAILNLIYEFVLRNKYFQTYLLPFQAYADLVILVILLHFSGGIENPLSLLMLFHVIIAGIVLTRRHCYAVAAAASTLLALMAVGEATHVLHHYTLTLFPHVQHGGELAHASHQPVYVISQVGLLSGIFFLTAYFVTTLSDRIRQSEQQLEKFADHVLEQRQLIEKAIETTNTGLCVCYSDGQPYWTNRRWEKWFGRESLHTYVDKNRLDKSVKACKTVKAGKTHSCEFTVPEDDPAGEARTYRITTAPLFGTEGQINHAVSLAQDITEQKRAQEQMIRAGKLAAVGELAGHVAHEVNNPIGIISAKARLLTADHSEEMSGKVQQELHKITDAADRVAKIAQGLLTYCRPSVASRSKMDLSLPIREAIALIEQQARNSGVVIDERLSEKLPLVEANVDEIQQVFLNLFLNALDAMPEGGTLTVLSSEYNKNGTGNNSNRYLDIIVQDTGFGVPPDIQEQVFEPFFTTKEVEKGTGLGLSICSGLIRSNGGSIDLESEPGRGTRFTIHLPVADNKKHMEEI